MWVETQARADHLGLCELGKKLVFILIVIKKSLEVLNKRKGLCYINDKISTLAAGLRMDHGRAKVRQEE